MQKELGIKANKTITLILDRQIAKMNNMYIDNHIGRQIDRQMSF